MAHRTFTPSEANSALAETRPLAERMVELAARLRVLGGERQAEVAVASAGNGSGYAGLDAQPPELVEAAVELRECVRRLRALGVQVKDIAAGLVDFPAVREGEEVLLCWRVGEEAVEWWHRHEEGFVGRKPIDWDDDWGGDA